MWRRERAQLWMLRRLNRRRKIRMSEVRVLRWWREVRVRVKVEAEGAVKGGGRFGLRVRRLRAVREESEGRVEVRRVRV